MSDAVSIIEVQVVRDRMVFIVLRIVTGFILCSLQLCHHIKPVSIHELQLMQ
jgi:hypothetical protein